MRRDGSSNSWRDAGSTWCGCSEDHTEERQSGLMAWLFSSSMALSGNICGSSSRAMVGVLLFMVVMFGAGVGLGSGEVYKVGDSAGWTIIGDVNYTAWSSSKNFHVGDTILFVYNKQFHNVLEVAKADYKACNGSSPIATYTSGNDSVTLKHKGHYFFICGFPTHCQVEQKVDIRIPKNASAAAPISPTPPPLGPALPPPQEGRAGPCCGGGRPLWWMRALAAVAGVGLAVGIM